MKLMARFTFFITLSLFFVNIPPVHGCLFNGEPRNNLSIFSKDADLIEKFEVPYINFDDNCMIGNKIIAGEGNTVYFENNQNSIGQIIIDPTTQAISITENIYTYPDFASIQQVLSISSTKIISLDLDNFGFQQRVYHNLSDIPADFNIENLLTNKKEKLSFDLNIEFFGSISNTTHDLYSPDKIAHIRTFRTANINIISYGFQLFLNDGNNIVWVKNINTENSQNETILSHNLPEIDLDLFSPGTSFSIADGGSFGVFWSTSPLSSIILVDFNNQTMQIIEADISSLWGSIRGSEIWVIDSHNTLQKFNYGTLSFDDITEFEDLTGSFPEIYMLDEYITVFSYIVIEDSFDYRVVYAGIILIIFIYLIYRLVSKESKFCY